MNSLIDRLLLIVLDGVGCGDAPDAQDYGDGGSNTLANLADAVGGLNLPNLRKLGLGNLTHIKGVPQEPEPAGSFGRLTEKSKGKDTMTGHWELCGLITHRPFPVYPRGFPVDIIAKFEKRIGRKVLGNIPASGTEIIAQLGEKHLNTGYPIVYTSADSVFQIAAHEGIIPVQDLYSMCKIARDLLVNEHAVGRVIARPFIGSVGAFRRTERRKDFSLPPPSETILDRIKASGKEVIGIGKIEDIFSNRGLTQSNHTGNNMAGVEAILDYLKRDSEGLIFANLVDFDALFGHRNDPIGFAKALSEFDQRLPDILGKMKKRDILLITADHGNDPTTPSTDHSRERVPILIAGNRIRENTDIGTRKSFADVADTISDLLGLEYFEQGLSFAKDIICI